MIHMLQTAEGIRKKGHPDWFQLVGLIHDMGKIMFLWGDEKDGQKGKLFCVTKLHPIIQLRYD